jgi:hypothetical protein
MPVDLDRRKPRRQRIAGPVDPATPERVG